LCVSRLVERRHRTPLHEISQAKKVHERDCLHISIARLNERAGRTVGATLNRLLQHLGVRAPTNTRWIRVSLDGVLKRATLDSPRQHPECVLVRHHAELLLAVYARRAMSRWSVFARAFMLAKNVPPLGISEGCLNG
jgi:hypothetical protein